jgi:hypothetical protein
MTAADVRELVHGQIGNNWDRSNLHKVNLQRCLVEPPRRMTFLDASDEKPVDAWLVLHEDPKSELGYAVVYDEESGEFGLAQFATGYEPCLIGIYGDFFTTLEAM